MDVMNETPSRIVVHCTVDGEPLSGAYVSVRLPMRKKNEHRAVFGPSYRHVHLEPLLTLPGRLTLTGQRWCLQPPEFH